MLIVVLCNVVIVAILLALGGAIATMIVRSRGAIGEALAFDRFEATPLRPLPA